jgi:hypothetical protein
VNKTKEQNFQDVLRKIHAEEAVEKNFTGSRDKLDNYLAGCRVLLLHTCVGRRLLVNKALLSFAVWRM